MGRADKSAATTTRSPPSRTPPSVPPSSWGTRLFSSSVTSGSESF
jgi:hypothetical protein